MNEALYDRHSQLLHAYLWCLQDYDHGLLSQQSSMVAMNLGVCRTWAHCDEALQLDLSDLSCTLDSWLSALGVRPTGLSVCRVFSQATD